MGINPTLGRESAGRIIEMLMSLQPCPIPAIPELTAQVAQAAFPKGTLAISDLGFDFQCSVSSATGWW